LLNFGTGLRSSFGSIFFIFVITPSKCYNVTLVTRFSYTQPFWIYVYILKIISINQSIVRYSQFSVTSVTFFIFSYFPKVFKVFLLQP
jgi:hypothetical protein